MLMQYSEGRSVVFQSWPPTDGVRYATRAEAEAIVARFTDANDGLNPWATYDDDNKQIDVLPAAFETVEERPAS